VGSLSGCASRAPLGDITRRALIGQGFMMVRHFLIFFVLLPTLCFAQNFSGYRASTLDALFHEWDEITKTDGPGVSYRQPEKIKFIATYQTAPQPCNNAELEMTLRLIDFPELLQKVQVNHCIGFVSEHGRKVVAYVQDVLVRGLNSDARVGNPIEIYADIFAYVVEPDRSRNRLILMVSRFEPQ
jgi:hypothetical protein